MNLDEELRAALRREDPSPGFANRVVARAQAQPAGQPFGFRLFGVRMMWATAIAAMLVLGTSGVFEYRQMEAERASRDAVLALRIAADKLNLARDRVLRRTEN